MARRKEELREERTKRNTAAATAASSVAMSDALLFTTMCIIGMPVDVYARDGSVYSGIFYTASVEKDYAVVLKKAIMIKKGNLEANVVNGTLIDTLIVGSEDLAQIVAKGVQIPSNGIVGYVWGGDVEAAAGYTDAEAAKPNELNGKKKHKSESRQVGDGSQEIRSDCHNTGVQEKTTIDEAEGSSLRISSCGAQSTGALDILENTIQQEPKGVSSGCSSALEDQDQGRAISAETACTVVSPPNGSVGSIPNFDVKSESCLRASSNPFLWVRPKGSSVERTAKESKLNPGAKTFSPSVLQNRMVVPNGASVPYIPGTCTVASSATAEEESSASSFTASSMPIKFTPYNNVAFGRGGNSAPHLQHVIGRVMNKTQPARYTGQYENFQTGPDYVYPNPQNGFGRVRPIVCMHPMHPISGDVQSGSGLSSVTPQPHLAPHQMHFLKNQA
ncbi:hypothetical protein OROGR_000355 [Orobanche gracilis]